LVHECVDKCKIAEIFPDVEDKCLAVTRPTIKIVPFIGIFEPLKVVGYPALSAAPSR
jgi:hypothetical protein